MKVLAGLALVILISMVGLPFGIGAFQSHKAESFCAGVAQLDTREGIVARANEAGYFVNPLDKDLHSVWVFSHMSPMWRYACIIEFRDGKVSGKKVVLAE